jgi:hypothetical protein
MPFGPSETLMAGMPSRCTGTVCQKSSPVIRAIFSCMVSFERASSTSNEPSGGFCVRSVMVTCLECVVLELVEGVWMMLMDGRRGSHRGAGKGSGVGERRGCRLVKQSVDFSGKKLRLLSLMIMETQCTGALPVAAIQADTAMAQISIIDGCQ